MSATAFEAEIASRTAELKKIQAEIAQLRKSKESAPEEAEVELLRQIFAKIDVSKDGSIELSELGKFSEELGYTMTEEEAEESFKELDKDESGSVSFDELKQWWFSDPAKSNVLSLRLLRARMGGAKFLDSLGVQIKGLKEAAASAPAPQPASAVVTPSQAAECAAKDAGVKIGVCACLGNKLEAETAPAGISVRVGASTEADRADGNVAYIECRGESQYIEKAATFIREFVRLSDIEVELVQKTHGMISAIKVETTESTLRVGIAISSDVRLMLQQVLPPGALESMTEKLSVNVDVLMNPAPSVFQAPDGYKEFSQSIGEIIEKALSQLTVKVDVSAQKGFYEILRGLPMVGQIAQSATAFKGLNVNLEFATIQELLKAAGETPMGRALPNLLQVPSMPIQPSSFAKDVLTTTRVQACVASIMAKCLGQLEGPTRAFVCVEALKVEVNFKALCFTQILKYMFSEVTLEELENRMAELKKEDDVPQQEEMPYVVVAAGEDLSEVSGVAQKCTWENPKSINAHTEVVVTMKNETSRNLRFHWINYEGEREPRFLLGPGESTEQMQTTNAWVYIATDEDDQSIRYGPWEIDAARGWKGDIIVRGSGVRH